MIDAPEIFVDCPECCGEGSVEVWQMVTRWSIDPPSSQPVTCPACHGTRGFICDAPGVAINDYDPRDDEE